MTAFKNIRTALLAGAVLTSVIFSFLAGSPYASAQGAVKTPVLPPLPKPVQLVRFVPTGEERTIGNVAVLNPDCSSRGPTVGRVIEKPAHGEVSFANGDVFPAFVQTSPLSACNEKRVPSLMINYHSESDFVGEDNMKIFLIFPDGSAAQWDYMFIVK